MKTSDRCFYIKERTARHFTQSGPQTVLCSSTLLMTRLTSRKSRMFSWSNCPSDWASDFSALKRKIYSEYEIFLDWDDQSLLGTPPLHLLSRYNENHLYETNFVDYIFYFGWACSRVIPLRYLLLQNIIHLNSKTQGYFPFFYRSLIQTWSGMK